MLGLLFGLLLNAGRGATCTCRKNRKNRERRKKDKTKWKVRPIIDPTLDYIPSIDSNTYYGLNVGAGVGLRYQQKKRGFRWQGSTRAQYVQTWSPKFLEPVSGQDIRVGTLIGPWWRIVGFQVGPEFRYNTYSNPGVEATEMMGVAPAASATVDLRVVSVTASAAPTFYVSGNRPGVDWNQHSFPGVGDEFTFSTRAGVDLWVVGFGAVNMKIHLEKKAVLDLMFRYLVAWFHIYSLSEKEVS